MRARVEELLTLVGLEPGSYAAKYPRELSGGEAQRVGVARALAADPPVLLMDEPFGAVDPLNRERLQGEFARIQRELRKTVIFVTHDVDEAIRLADRIALMKDGALHQYDTPERLLDHPADKFVHDFMGADRALKRLVRVRVDSVMDRDVPRIDVSAASPGMSERAACAAGPFAYVVDAEGVMQGWLDCRTLESGEAQDWGVTPIDWRESTVRPDASLKEALSRMLELGFRSIAVTDDAGRLLGDLPLSAVEATLAKGASRIAPPSESGPPR
jgi:osmoprotectant transport system ATP-binding protein